MKILFTTYIKYRPLNIGVFLGTFFKSIKPEVKCMFVAPETAGIEEISNCKMMLRYTEEMLETVDIKVDHKFRQGDWVDETLKEMERGNYDLLAFLGRGSDATLPGVSETTTTERENRLIANVRTSILAIRDSRPLRKVLICTDGSGSAEGAVRFWCEFKNPFLPKVNVLNVVPQIYSHFQDYLGPVDEDQLNMLSTLPGKRTEYLYNAKRILANHDIEAKVKLREGRAADEIVDESSEGYDLIVMGFHGRKGEMRETLGRQDRRVLEKAKVSVMVYKTADKGS